VNLNQEYKDQKLLTKEFREERNRYMGKVRYELTDGSTPEKTDGVMKLKAPMDITLSEDERMSIALGVTFSVPTVLLENPYMAKRGLKIVNAGTLVLPGVEPVVNIQLTDARSLEVERGQTIVFSLPLDSNFELEKS